MDFIKLPANSEKLLLELLQADNPVQMLGVRFEQASQRDDDELRGMLRELRERGYINVQWADNVPYYLTLNNSARTYKEQLAEYEDQKTVHFLQEKKVSPIIFISHRSTDKAIADRQPCHFRRAPAFQSLQGKYSHTFPLSFSAWHGLSL